ncbi:hypothetical protein [Croceimicrobium sp.]|uniref:hypothetical protein n=1 Tax=Croceimicrobium sp. TaxID=2828340 RepID=UPI003BA8773C
MKKFIPVAALLLIAAACSKNDDREEVYQEPQPIVTDTSNDLPPEDEIINPLH